MCDCLSQREQRHEGEIPMDEARVRALLRAQFPQWADLQLREWDEQGTDHTLFRLGDDMVVRMPIRPFNNAALEEQQCGREARWLPFLAPQVPLALPEPRGLGTPTEDYPWHWSIVSWIPGERATRENIDRERAAVDLAAFIRALHAVDATDGPPAGAVTFGRGLPLRRGARLIRDAIDRVADRYDVAPIRAAFEEALEVGDWDRPPVWFHGDLDGNLISRDGVLVGVIDSAYGVGDPACDLMAGWTLFTGKSRAAFFEALDLDEATKIRSRGWVLAPACYGLTYYAKVPSMLRKTEQAIAYALAD
jgi:aminoglycoside phosphotransferase (APT) family kinase protein